MVRGDLIKTHSYIEFMNILEAVWYGRRLHESFQKTNQRTPVGLLVNNPGPPLKLNLSEKDSTKKWTMLLWQEGGLLEIA